MGQKKQLKELTIRDNFMFGAVMMEEENCRRFLELALGFLIERVEVSREKSIVYHPEYKGVRLDVYAKDEKNTRYNVEMQVAKRPELGKRVRYYHGHFEDDFVRTLQETIHRIRISREMEERCMIFEEMLRDERAEGRAEGRIEGIAGGILDLLGDLGNVSDEVCDRIRNEKNLDTLTDWLKAAAKAGSIEDFLNQI